MKLNKEDLTTAAAGVGLALWLLGIPQAILDRLKGRPPRPRFYVPASTKRFANPGNVREELDRD